ncbi:hypothetical protein [Myxococcus sp. RHSTA-1-4]|uniref:hypothetical protein n=1 Tax=Myxococcus sp. RHSTA-1-4 TaxID=2874601 RepID=UPI001CBBDCAE|nr:hypothetical protein [Myxococcus sp. RHSTA-1-4]MBZ4422784.1 hypothetical protein [Myxococcus sp. RHSTA-1-4]
MDYVDYTLVRLAADGSRAALFDQVSLEHVLFAAYDSEAMTLSGPYSPVFEQFFIGLSVPRRSLVEGAWGPSTQTERHEARFTLHAPGADGVRVDAFWRGAIIARASGETATVDHVVSRWPDLESIDAEIAAALGALPEDPAVLEAERRARLLARLRAGVRQPEALSEAWLEGWLARAGAASVGGLLRRMRGQAAAGTFQLGLSAPGAGTPSARPLPLAAALLIRSAPLSVAQLVADSKLVREHLEQLGMERPRSPQSEARHALVVIWVVPETTFDDAGWPGGEDAGLDAAIRRQRRRATAGLWLAREGIGLVATPASS